MERKSKKDLLLYIEQQEESLQKYKRRLHDVVESYKHLVKEKEALEVSVKILTEASSLTCEETNSVINKNSGSNSGDNTASISEDGNPDEPIHLQTLKTTLATLTEEKSRSEQELKADRKKLLQEKEDTWKQFNESKDVWNQEKDNLEKKIQELKKRVRDQQREREKEQQDHVVMLKELQSLLADERASKERLENQVDDLKQALEKFKTSDKKTAEYEKYIFDLKLEIRSMKEKLHISEDKARKPPPLLLQLQEEMSEMKIHHQRAVEQENKRANEAEEKLKSLAIISEERVASLESHLSELSQMIGNYDRLREQDQISIQKLKERVTQLDLENSALARTVTGDKGKQWEMDDDSNLDVQTLMDRITKLKGHLRLANQRSERPITITDFLNEVDESEFNPHSRCQEELQQLKEEFERYKLRAQSVLKNKNSKDSEVSEEVNSLKTQVASLQEQLETCRSQMESAEEYHRKVKNNLQSTLQEMKIKQKHDIAHQESEHRTKLLELEQQMQKQRERTLVLLEEKEKEINLLRSTFLPAVLLGENHPKEVKAVSRISEETAFKSVSASSSSEVDSLTDMLSRSLISSKKEGQLLHYAQELARKDVETSNLRRSRLQAESALRELQQVALAKEEKYTDEISTLKSQIKRLECNQSSEGINMEYLKNVVFRYIICQDTSDRTHMLNAIATVLHFTPHELLEVKAFNQSWWWNGSNAKQ